MRLALTIIYSLFLTIYFLSYPSYAADDLLSELELGKTETTEQLLKSFPGEQEKIRQGIERKYFLALLHGQGEQAENIKKSTAELFFAGDEINIKLDRLRLIDQAAKKSRSAQGVIPETLLAEAGTQYERYLLQYHSSLAKLDSDPASVLEFLVDPNFPNDVRVEILARTLSVLGTKVELLWPRLQEGPSQELEKLYENLLQRDPSLTPTYLSYLSWAVLDSVRKAELDRVNELFSKVIGFRPDPSQENNDLRYQIILEAKSPEIQGFAQGRRSELDLHGGLSFSQKLKLLIRGQSLELLMLLGFALLGALLVTFALYGVLKILEKSKGKMTKLEDRNQPGFLGSHQAEGFLTRQDEYSRLLQLFDLTDTCTENDIKKAYRRKMKELHPDSGKSLNDQEMVEFRDLQEAYEKILTMRKSWFMGRRR